ASLSVTRTSRFMLQVDSGVYIGSVDDLNDRQMLADASVSHILSLDSVDPGPMLPADGSFVTKWIDVLDDPTSDLLSHMDACFMFIDEAVKGVYLCVICCFSVQPGGAESQCHHRDRISNEETPAGLH
uniref:Uncharacterized protein n=1 Tax=Nothobranchius furzeri TaxID=105023 RepID=A0A8C6M4W1_NOTFU